MTLTGAAGDPIVPIVEDGDPFPYLDDYGRPRSPSLYDVLEKLQLIEDKLDALSAQEGLS